MIELVGIDETRFNAARDRELAEIERRRQCYLGDRPRLDITGRVAIVVDDGVATGATTRAALRSVAARKPVKLVLAIPVAPAEAIAALRQEVDDVVCLEAHENFRAIGLYYDNFRQVRDDEVRLLLSQHPAGAAPAVP
ncbi:MAG: phosphoribosyltransferase [Reyranella sp.]